MNNERTRSKLSLNREARQAGPAIEERLHKVLANAGLGSRRLLEERIEAGDVKLNAAPATIGSSVRVGDRVELDGKAFMVVASEPEDAEVLIYHKPEGVVTTNDDPEGRPTVFEQLPRLKGARWVSVGRLDINTTGLLLLTTDGELANALMHPSSEIQREYVCRIHGTVTEEILQNLRRGVELEDGPARFDEIATINMGDTHSWFRVVLHEGRNREVRRMWESQGLEVSRLKRIRYGSIELPRQLRRGHVEPLSPEAYRELRSQLGLGEVPQTLTLQPVIGVRKATRQPTEIKGGRSQDSYSHGHAAEARELRAFDFVRDDKDSRPGRGAPKRGRGKGPGGGFAGPGRGGPKGAPGARPPRGRGARGGPPGERNGNSAEMRSWTPGGGGANAPGGARRANKRRGGGGAPAMPYGFPSDHAYAKRDSGYGQGQPGNGPARGPGGGGPGGRPGGRPSGRPGGRFGDRPGADSRGNGPGGGNRGNAPGGNRGPRPGGGGGGNRNAAPGGNRGPGGGNRGNAPGGNRGPRPGGPGGGGRRRGRSGGGGGGGDGGGNR